MKKIMLLIVMALAVLSLNAQTRTKIKPAELQKSITNTITKDYAGSAIKSATKVENKGLISYEVMIVKGDQKSKLIFGKDGKFLRKEVYKSSSVKKNDAKTQTVSTDKKK